MVLLTLQNSRRSFPAGGTRVVESAVLDVDWLSGWTDRPPPLANVLVSAFGLTVVVQHQRARFQSLLQRYRLLPHEDLWIYLNRAAHRSGPLWVLASLFPML